MNDTKIKIMEKLWDLVDKELKFGCKVKYYNWCGSYVCSFWELNHIEDLETQIKKWHDQIYIKRDWQEWLDNELVEHLKNNNKIEILWQYHLWTILRWLKQRVNIYEDGRWIHAIHHIDLNKFDILLNLDKPPMERSEEEDKKLLSFMESVEK